MDSDKILKNTSDGVSYPLQQRHWVPRNSWDCTGASFYLCRASWLGVHKGGTKSFTTLCSSLQLTWSCHSGSGYLCSLLMSREWGRKWGHSPTPSQTVGLSLEVQLWAEVIEVCSGLQVTAGSSALCFAQCFSGEEGFVARVIQISLIHFKDGNRKQEGVFPGPWGTQWWLQQSTVYRFWSHPLLMDAQRVLDSR
jgi:hypothetical protein